MTIQCCQRLVRRGRDYSRSKQFLPSIRCQTSFGLPRTIKADEVSRPELGGGPGNGSLRASVLLRRKYARPPAARFPCGQYRNMSADRGRPEAAGRRSARREQPSADLTHTAGIRAVLRHSIDMCRDVHGQHAWQKATENLQSRMTTRRAVEVIPYNEQQQPRDKDADRVYVKP
jgi:hypothetical protein